MEFCLQNAYKCAHYWIVVNYAFFSLMLNDPNNSSKNFFNIPHRFELV